MKETNWSHCEASTVVAVVCITIGCMFWSSGNAWGDQTPPTNLSPGLQEVVKLAQAKMNDDVILAYIKNSGTLYTLVADDIVYLKSQGVSENVISVLLQTKSTITDPTASAVQNPATQPAPTVDNSRPPGPQDYTPAPVAASPTASSFTPKSTDAPDPDELNFAYFQAELGPYGEWVDIADNGSCWVPAVVKVNPDWRPYVDQGKWMYTDQGWFWKSEYPWGEIVFHYGRWFNHPVYRWAWKPGFEWAPAWVVWRKDEPVAQALPPAAPPPPPESAPTVRQMEDWTHQQIPVAQAPVDPVSANENITFHYFHDQLAPFGTWVEVPNIGPCWYPEKVIASNPDWRPYYDSGHWVQTDNGLFWASDYTWGDIPFHYGRWIQDPQYGWLWVPGYNWGPAWVCWRDADADGYIGWAPLPYGAVWVNGGWRFHGNAVVDVGFGFGLGEASFVFVGADHFHEDFPHRLRGRDREYAFHIDRARVHEMYSRSVVRNEFHHDEHGRLVNGGIGRERLDHLTKNRVEKAKLEERAAVGNREQQHRVPTVQPRQPGSGPSHPAPVSNVYKPPTPSRSNGAKASHSGGGTTSRNKKSE